MRLATVHTVWSTFESRPGWHAVPWFDERAYACAKAANGDFWEETITELKQFDFVECFQTPHGVAILVDEGDELCIKAFHGRNYGDAIQDMRGAAREAGFKYARGHTDKTSVLRYWLKLGIEPTEYVYREEL